MNDVKIKLFFLPYVPKLIKLYHLTSDEILIYGYLFNQCIRDNDYSFQLPDSNFENIFGIKQNKFEEAIHRLKNKGLVYFTQTENKKIIRISSFPFEEDIDL